VTIVIRRSVGVLVGLSAAAVLLSACGSGPSQVGSALIVGNTSVSVDQVQQELDNVLNTQPAIQQAQQQGNLDVASRNIVTTHVLHQLAARAVGEYHITVNDQQVDQLITQSGGISKVAATLYTDPADTREAVKDVLIEAALARKYADTLTVDFGYVTTTNRAEAIRYGQQIAANPGALTSIVNSANAAAQAAGSQGGAGQTDAQLSIAQYLSGVQQAQQQAQQQGQQAPTENDGPVFGTPVNSVVVFQPDPPTAGQPAEWVVALIKSRANGPSSATGGQSVADTSDLGTLEGIGQSLLQSDATALGIKISPRYGVWDQVGMHVVADGDQDAGAEFPARHVSS
jgi:hypothetical protein